MQSKRNSKEWRKQQRKERRIDAAYRKLNAVAWFGFWVMAIWIVGFIKLRF